MTEEEPVQGYVPVPNPGQWMEAVDSVVVPGALGLTTGLHLMIGPKASGKTLTAYAMAISLKRARVKVTYAYVMEPRALFSSHLISGDNWNAFYQAMLDATKGGVIIIDSLTYLLNRLTIIKVLEKDIGKVTYKEGLTPRDILSVLMHDEMAREAGVCVIATLNSELFPVVDKLEGACEGQLQLLSPGTFKMRSRKTRAEIIHSIDPSVLDAAARKFGFTKPGSFTEERA